LVTVPLPLVEKITFTPAIPEKLRAAQEIGYGAVIKILLRFKERWWESRGEKFKELSFLFSDQEIPTWWTQNPELQTTLTGWLAGPRAKLMSESSEEELLTRALASLARIFD